MRNLCFEETRPRCDINITYVINATSEAEQIKAGSAVACGVCALPNLVPPHITGDCMKSKTKSQTRQPGATSVHGWSCLDRSIEPEASQDKVVDS